MSSQNPKVDFIFSYVNYALTINCPPSVTVAADKSIESTVPSALSPTCRPAALVCEASYTMLIKPAVPSLSIAIGCSCCAIASNVEPIPPLPATEAPHATTAKPTFAVEVIADNQKLTFRRENPDDFIALGLWRYSRHPNYLGEILLWLGIAILALPVLQGWQLATMISPVFVILLLTKISGVRMLEDRANQKWVLDPTYQADKNYTPVLIPGLRV